MVNLNKAKLGSFKDEEKETVILSCNDETEIVSSEFKIITKILKLYGDVLTVEVLYYAHSTTTNETFPTCVKVKIPSKQFFSLRSFKH